MAWNNQPLQRPSPLGTCTFPKSSTSLRSQHSQASAEAAAALGSAALRMEQRFINRCLLGSPQLPKTAGNGSVPASSEHPAHRIPRQLAPSTRGARAEPVGDRLAHHGDTQDARDRYHRLSPVPTSTTGSARLLPPPRAGCALALWRPWPPASQPFPGNLIAAADELKMHFLPPCCKIFINVRRERSAGSRHPGPWLGGGQRGASAEQPGPGGELRDGSGVPGMLREGGGTGPHPPPAAS